MLDTRYWMLDTGCSMRVTRCGLWVARCGLRVTRCGLRVAGCGLRVAGWGSLDLGFRNWDLGLKMTDRSDSTIRHSLLLIRSVAGKKAQGMEHRDKRSGENRSMVVDLWIQVTGIWLLVICHWLMVLKRPRAQIRAGPLAKKMVGLIKKETLMLFV